MLRFINMSYDVNNYILLHWINKKKIFSSHIQIFDVSNTINRGKFSILFMKLIKIVA